MASRRQAYMQLSEQMWAQSQGMHMHMPGGRPSGHMAMQGGMPMQMSGSYMVPGMMPGMMPGMPMMGPGTSLTHRLVALQVPDCCHASSLHCVAYLAVLTARTADWKMKRKAWQQLQEIWVPLYRISRPDDGLHAKQYETLWSGNGIWCDTRSIWCDVWSSNEPVCPKR